MKIEAKSDLLDSKDALTLLAIGAIWAGIFSFSGIFTAGFNYFVDDHAIVVSHYNYTSFNDIIVAPFTSLFSSDIKSRFRPLYDVFIRFFSQLYGLNSWAWYFSSFLVASATTAIFYLVGRLQKFSYLKAAGFALLVTFGQQASTYARLGTPETTSTFLLSLAFLCASLKDRNSQQSFLTNCFFVSFALMAALNKEACILMLPALCFFKVWSLSNRDRIELTAAFIKSSWSVIPLLAVFLGFIAYIKRAKVNGPGYAGVDAGTLSIEHLSFSFTNNGALFGLAILAGIVYASAPGRSKIGMGWIVSAAIAIPQLILYNKTGMAWHYVLPCAIGISFMTVYLIDKISDRFKLQSNLLMVVAIGVIILQIFVTYNYFCEANNRLARIKTLVSDMSACVGRLDKLAIVGNPYTDYEILYAFNQIIAKGIIKTERPVLVTYADRGANLHLNVMKDREKSWYFLNPQELEKLYQHQTIDTLSSAARTKIAGIVLMNSHQIEKLLANLKLDWFSPELLSNKYYPELDMSFYCKSRLGT
jgi:hypothetical protein